MVHATSPKGIIGLGALGQAIDQLLPVAANPAAILFTVKAFDLERALVEQSCLWPEQIPFVTLCNGYIWPVIEKVYPQLNRRPIRIGMTTIGSTIKSNGNVRIFSENTMTAWGYWPDLKVISVKPAPEELNLLKQFPGGVWFDDIRPIIRRKWIMNVVINSVGAAYKLKQNGLLKGHRGEVEEALAEAIDLAQRLWPQLPFELSEQTIISELLWQVVDATSGNQNSMVRDVLLGRPTESDYLAGIALHYDDFPLLKRLHRLIAG